MQAVLDRMTPAFVYDPSLVLYLPLRQLDSVSFADHSAYGHLCTNYQAILWGLQGYYVDGIDDYMQVAYSSALTSYTSTNEFSLVSVAKIPPPFTGGGYAWIMGGVNWNYCMRVNSDRSLVLYFCSAASWSAYAALTAAAAVSLGNWHTFIGTFDQAALHLYIDGVEQVLATHTPPPLPLVRLYTTAFCNISSEIQPFYVGEQRVYNRCLRPAEVQRIHVETKSRYS